MTVFTTIQPAQATACPTGHDYDTVACPDGAVVSVCRRCGNSLTIRLAPAAPLPAYPSYPVWPGAYPIYDTFPTWRVQPLHWSLQHTSISQALDGASIPVYGNAVVGDVAPRSLT